MLCLIAEITAEMPQCFSQLPELIAACRFNLLLRSKRPILQKLGRLRGGSYPGDKGAAGAESRAARCKAETFLTKPQRILLSVDDDPLASLAELLFHKRGSLRAGRLLLKKGNDTLHTVRYVAAAGEGAAHYLLRRLPFGKGYLLLYGLLFRAGLRNIFNLFLYRGKKGKAEKRFRNRNGGLRARRFLLLIYL